MATHYTDVDCTDDHRIAPHGVAPHGIGSHGGLLRDGAAGRGWFRAIGRGGLVVAGLLALAALPIALRFWLALPELTRFSH